MTVWLVVVAVSTATVAIKAAGPVLLGGRRLPDPVMATLSLLAPALLCALVATAAFGADRRIVIDARAAGLAVAAVAVWRRAPPLLVVTLAAVTTALLRL
jgi:branched-subunit amino acid transport protein